MLHGHHEMGNGTHIETVGFFFAWGIFSIFAAYYTMKFMVYRRDARERAEKRQGKAR